MEIADDVNDPENWTGGFYGSAWSSAHPTMTKSIRLCGICGVPPVSKAAWFAGLAGPGSPTPNPAQPPGMSVAIYMRR